MTVSGFRNGVPQVKDEDMVRVGTAHVGDIGSSSGAQAVSGYLTSASTSSVASATTLTVVYPDLGFVPVVIVTDKSLGTLGLDNDTRPPPIYNITSTGFNALFEETAAGAQDITLMIALFYEFI